MLFWTLKPFSHILITFVFTGGFLHNADFHAHTPLTLCLQFAESEVKQGGGGQRMKPAGLNVPSLDMSHRDWQKKQRRNSMKY